MNFFVLVVFHFRIDQETDQANLEKEEFKWVTKTKERRGFHCVGSSQPSIFNERRGGKKAFSSIRI